MMPFTVQQTTTFPNACDSVLSCILTLSGDNIYGICWYHGIGVPSGQGAKSGVTPISRRGAN
jgi:hypothetical protein